MQLFDLSTTACGYLHQSPTACRNKRPSRRLGKIKRKVAFLLVMRFMLHRPCSFRNEWYVHDGRPAWVGLLAGAYVSR
jgi:hypothetical protein